MIANFGLAGLLIALGVSSYLRTGRKSPTALIPAAFGGVVVVAQLLPGSAISVPVVAGLGGLMTLRGAIKWVRARSTEAGPSPAQSAQASMALVCFSYLALALTRG